MAENYISLKKVMNDHQLTDRFMDQGTVVFLDLDNFETCIQRKNWSRYSPNPITRYLTKSIIHLVREYRALCLWGLDEARGTEEAILFFQYNKEFIRKLLEELRKEILALAKEQNAPTSLSVGLASGRIPRVKKIEAHSKREFKKDPAILLAYRAMKKAKKKGGNRLIVY